MEEIVNIVVILIKHIHTARGKPRRANTIKAAILIDALAPITCSIPPEYSLIDIKLIIAVTAMEANTI